MSLGRVLVTGSSRGIGRAIASRLASDGWTVALHYSSERALAEQLGSELNATGIYGANLDDPVVARGLIPRVLSDGPLHAVVNNAGVYMPLPFLEESDNVFEATLQRTFAVNLMAPIRLMREVGQHFRNQGGGKVVNVASRVGFKGESNAALYAASKAGLINLTRSLAVEWAPYKIGVFGIAPGWVETAMARDGMQDRLPTILKDIPAGRMASPDDCAAAVSFLLRDDAAYLSGNVIDINGASYFH